MTSTLPAPWQPRAERLFKDRLNDVHMRHDRLFLWLMVAQWIFAVGLAAIVSPRTWAGRTHTLHIHVIFALLVGGALLVPVANLVALRPGSALTRHVIAFTQMLWSALLIHLSGGRIETHFHVFGSLAFLAFYRDWKVLVTATIAVAGDHLLRGLLWPVSVYGIANPEWWRFLEHAGWVVFEDIVLVMGVLENIREMHALASGQAELEYVNTGIERTIAERTTELAESNTALKENLDLLHKTQGQLVEASRRTGMADVATAVLHNVGNVLNSVNVSASMVAETLRKSKLEAVTRTAELLRSKGPEVGRFVTEDEKGRRIPDYLARLGESLATERMELVDELGSLQKNIDHIKVIVSMQQTHARSSGGALETLSLTELLEDALKFVVVACERDRVEVVREFSDQSIVTVDRHKLFQIVVNLLSNARHAVKDRPDGQRLIKVRVDSADGDKVVVQVIDTGCGIAPENRSRIFNHGFTTKKEGHGFGLHSSALAARELGGELRAHSDGVNQGATFTVEFPRSPVWSDGAGPALASEAPLATAA